jgi:hypothetical protein
MNNQNNPYQNKSYASAGFRGHGENACDCPAETSLKDFSATSSNAALPCKQLAASLAELARQAKEAQKLYGKEFSKRE